MSRALDRDLLLGEPPRSGRPARRGCAALTAAEVAVQVVVVLAARQLLLAVTQPGAAFPVVAAAVAAVAAVLTFLVVGARHRFQERLAVASRTRAVGRLARHLHHADVEDLAATPMAGLREVLMTDVDFAYRFLLESVGQLTVLLAWLVAAVAVTAWTSLPLLGVLVVLGAVVAAVMLRATRAHLALTTARFARLGAVSQRARDVVEVERVVVARQFGLGDVFVARFRDAHAQFAAVAEAQGRVTATMRAAQSSLGALTFLAVVVAGGALVLAADLPVGSLVAVLFVLAQLLAAVAALGDYGGRLAETATAGRRLTAFWDDPAPPPPLPPPRAGDAIDAVVARGLTFGWSDGPTVLRDVDVELRRGRPVALTAATGAGKSTLALLLTGVLAPNAGDVHVVRADGSAAPAGQARPGRVLYVGSKPVLVPGSILDNLLLEADPGDAGTADPAEAARFVTRVTAGALPFAVDDVVVGPNGTGLSSGQAQLVQLARAVHREPDVIVLDEATSALDIETEAAVQRGLLEWCRQRTTLVVSHRSCPWTEAAVEHLGLVPAPAGGGLTVASRAELP